MNWRLFWCAGVVEGCEAVEDISELRTVEDAD